jgi:hypothetical protein
VLLPLEEMSTGGAVLARRLNGTPLSPTSALEPLFWLH